MKKALWISLALCLLAGAVLFVGTLEDAAEVSDSSTQVQRRPVRFVEARTGLHTGTVSVYAEVAPRWQADIRSRVAGVVREVAPAALEGARVRDGSVLVELENAPYLAGLEEARFALQKAELDLLRAEKKRDIALKDWRAVKPAIAPPDMAIHLPEVRVAAQSVAAAKSRVEAADYDLRSTQVRAPFDAIITKRAVSPGQSVTEGDVLFTLLDDRVLDISVSLTEREWALLDPNWSGEAAQVLSDADRPLGVAHIRRGGGFLDPKSRRYQLFLEVDKAENQAILPGQFVRVLLPGKAMDKTLQVPESALTQNGFVWYLDADDRLQRFGCKALFRTAGEVIVAAPAGAAEGAVYRVVTLPMSAYLPGQTVAPVAGEAAL
ncbi:efflux RND transporter periplasmic adaptor subunit [Roseibium sediminicola]|uniref:Efflux RND transporter periplasmic adaptor subunit n=1 Tax=Roseibium sediminicola TaxID=2933272 RepID=A0ABT0GSM4_9HYPH|nr:efflux RND transporter periplasmic adaptor subunit [Roseibium sp. CAU 1639]MCK7612442.1 efflux RND transporter periplasmic adaptor subunit [Roseibium sp. CAU 1639]